MRKLLPRTETRRISFTHHSDLNQTVDGWVLLETHSNTGNDEYVFGYNKKLAPTDETVTLFDEVQLKSFIDNEKKGSADIGVYCYGIQAKNLVLDDSVNLASEPLAQEDISAIYSIVKNKAGLS